MNVKSEGLLNLAMLWFKLLNLLVVTVLFLAGHTSSNPVIDGNTQDDYLTLISMESAYVRCGESCYKVNRDDILRVRSLEEIESVDVQFKDYGSQSAEEDFQNDWFVVHRKHPSSKIGEFNVLNYDFYRKRRRSADVTNSLRSFLANETRQYYYLKFRKINDNNEGRFDGSESPSLVLHSNQPQGMITSTNNHHRGRRQVSSSTQRCSDDVRERNGCCLLNISITDNVKNQTQLEFFEFPDDFVVTVCAGRCYSNPQATNLQRILDTSYRGCCTAYGPLRSQRLVYTTGSTRTENNFQIDATQCTCT